MGFTSGPKYLRIRPVYVSSHSEEASCHSSKAKLILTAQLLPGGAFDVHQGRAHESKGMRHTGMPRGVASNLRGVIGDQHAVVAIAMQDREHVNHVDLTVVDEGFAIMRHPAGDIAEVNVPEPLLPAVGVDSLIKAVSGHLTQRAKAELELVAGARVDVDEAL